MEKLENSITKDEFCKVLQKELATRVGVELNLEKVYDVFKLCTLLPYHLSTTKGSKVTLSGIGVFRTYKTNHTGTEVAKYYCADTIRRLLTRNLSLLEYVSHPQVYRNPEYTGIEDEEPKKVTKKSVKKAPAKEVVVEKVEEPKKVAKKAPKVAKKAEIEQELVADIDDEDIDLLDDFEL